MRKKFKAGLAFSDFVEERNFKFSSGKTPSSYFNKPDFLFLIPIFALVCIFLVLLMRLFYVQVVQGAYYSRLADDNRTRSIVIPAPRGIIFDRMKRPLVRNVPVFEIIEKGKATIISKDEALKLISRDKNVLNSVAREYLYKDTFSHVLGYTGQITEEQITMPEFKEYAISDFVGKIGLENTYESLLHGTNGRELYEVNAAGKRIGFLGKQEPVPGENIQTTLNLDLQKAAKKALEKFDKGAVVVSNPKNGEILALYSKPSFDPNLFTQYDGYTAEGDYKSRESVLLDGEKFPLLDRSIAGTYPPGSTYKLITASAALSSDSITPRTEIEDTGVISIGGASFGTWNYLQNGKKEGTLNLEGALRRSNDIYFYKIAEKLGVEKLDFYSKEFGLGKVTGIDLPGEAAGTVPGIKWKKRTIGDNWYLGDTYNMSIGQGYLLTTPLQINIMTQIVANGGTYFKPHLIMGNEKVVKKDLVKEEDLNVIRQGMKGACEVGGTAYPLFNFRVRNDRLKVDNLNYFQSASFSAGMNAASESAEIKNKKVVLVKTGCKTGTAEAHGLGDPDPHAWFTIFAPFYDPEIVITVLVENGGEGSTVASPIAREILKEYFERK